MEIVNFIEPQYVTIFIQIALAVALGSILGMERAIAHKTAGMRTYALISMGSTLFVTISQLIAAQYSSSPAINPLLLPAQVVAGIGFIGGGLIFVHGNTVKGLTTAAGLWVTAGIGMAIGFKLYAIAIFVTLMTLFIFKVMWRIEEQIKHISDEGNECQTTDEEEVINI